MLDENEQGREIVLGNKQLLSMFFIVAALIGVAFTMGYIIGRNTTAVSAASNTTSVPPVVNKTPPAETPDDNAVAPVTRTPSNDPEAAPPPVTGTQPAKPYHGSSPVVVAPVPAPPAPAPDESAPASPATVSSGSYLQVAALKRQDADHMVEALRKRGYAALLGESPKEGLFRVLIGPFKDMAALADSKQRLKAAGIETIVAR